MSNEKNLVGWVIFKGYRRGGSSLESAALDPNFNQPEIPTFHETNTGSLFPLTIGSMGLVCEWLIFMGKI